MSKERFIEEFNILIRGYCEGLKSFPGEVHDELVCTIVRDLKPIILESFAYSYEFNLIDITEEFCEAGMFRIEPKKVLGELLAMLPNPSKLNLEQQNLLDRILVHADDCVPGTLDRMNWEWQQAA